MVIKNGGDDKFMGNDSSFSGDTRKDFRPAKSGCCMKRWEAPQKLPSTRCPTVTTNVCKLHVYPFCLSVLPFVMPSEGPQSGP